MHCKIPGMSRKWKRDEREKARERGTEGQRDREREGERERKREREKEKERNREKERRREIHREREKEKERAESGERKRGSQHHIWMKSCFERPRACRPSVIFHKPPAGHSSLLFCPFALDPLACRESGWGSGSPPSCFRFRGFFKSRVDSGEVW